MVGVDIFRVANGKIAEHWDVLQEEVPAAQSANGNTMFSGPQGEVRCATRAVQHARLSRPVWSRGTGDRALRILRPR